MFTRHVIMQLKPNATTEFANVVESKVLPLLRKQKGFRKELQNELPAMRTNGFAYAHFPGSFGRTGGSQVHKVNAGN